jgi:hypothetical protein
MPSSSQHSFPNIFNKGAQAGAGAQAGTSIAFTTPTQPSGNGSASLNINESVYKAGMVRPL